MHVKAFGSMNLDENKKMSSEAIAAAIQYRCERFLIDHRDMTPELSRIGIFFILLPG